MASLLNMSGRALVKMPYDAEIEYLESSGTQWIDTGIVPSYSNTKVEIDVFTTLSSGTSSYMFGCGHYRQNNRFFIQTENSKFSIGIATTYEITNIKKGRAIVTFSPNDLYSYKVTINDITYIYTLNQAGTPVDTINVLKTADTRIYYLKIYNNNTLLRDFIPVRIGNVGYLYDKVSGQLFGNSGTGDFILGPDKTN